jgi:RimJ/RimL family protein N-acetyltransferase
MGSNGPHSAVTIRLVRRDDEERLAEHFRSLSATSTYFRFFGPRRRLSARELSGLTEIDFRRRAALAATTGSGSTERIVGVAQYIVVEGGRADLACSVIDEYQGRGVGLLLLRSVLALARANGIAEFESEVLGDNQRMLSLLTKNGLAKHRSVESGVVHLTFSGDEADQALRIAA